MSLKATGGALRIFFSMKSAIVRVVMEEMGGKGLVWAVVMMESGERG